MTVAPLTLRGANPDVLDCIANLSNDEVFTPPALANQMLDDLDAAWLARYGSSIWSDSSVRFLDPSTKSGVFLREIVKRLNEGLKGEFPDLQQRVDHIMGNQVFAIGITQLTTLLARRSVYCSKQANGPHSITTVFDTEVGNIWYERIEHTWTGGRKQYQVDPLPTEEKFVYTNRRCAYCGAGEDEYGRGDALETHAYAFIHTDDISARIAEIFGENMHFDVIIANPPYQLSDGGHNRSASPIYQHFVERALDLDPKYAVFVTPSRWFAGGKGLDEYRNKMLSDRRMRKIVDYPKLYEVFDVKIRGGVSYFLWDQDHNGACEIQTMWDGEPVGAPRKRHLDAYDIFVRRNESVSILEKVREHNEPTLDRQVSSRKPFGLATNFDGARSTVGMTDAVRLYANQKTLWIERSELPRNPEWVEQWKVLMTAVQGTSAAVETKFLSKPIIAGPGTACTETYLVAGRFSDQEQALSLASYLRTRFVRFLVSLRKSTQHATRDVYSFVPEVPLDHEWTDGDLYERYELNPEEIAFVEDHVAAHAPEELEVNEYG